jgi:hypothetical protein
VLGSLRAEGLLDVVDDRRQRSPLPVTRLMQDDAIGRHRRLDRAAHADEFVAVTRPDLVPPARRRSAAVLPWRSYVPHDDDPPGRNPPLRIRRRLASEARTLSKVIAPAALGSERRRHLAGQPRADDRRAAAAVAPPSAHRALRPVGPQFLAKTVIGHLQNEVMPYRDSAGCTTATTTNC